MTDMESKDGLMKIREAWINEIQECNGMSRVEADTIKAFLSTVVDKYRPPYGRNIIQAKRIGIIVGTTNNREGVLRDVTGNRRFWPVNCYKDKQTKSSLEMTEDEALQILAEAKYYYDAGESLLLDQDVEAEAIRQQEDAVVTDAAQGELEHWLDMDIPEAFYKGGMTIRCRQDYYRGLNTYASELKKKCKREMVCNPEIWKEFFLKDTASLSRADISRITRMMEKAGWERDKKKKVRYGCYGPQFVWRRARGEQIAIKESANTNP